MLLVVKNLTLASCLHLKGIACARRPDSSKYEISYKRAQWMGKCIAGFSLFLGFTIAWDYQGYHWFPSFLSQYDAKKFKNIFGDLQTTNY